MEKKIIELSITEVQAVVGGVKTATVAAANFSVSASANAAMARPLSATPTSLPSRVEALLARL